MANDVNPASGVTLEEATVDQISAELVRRQQPHLLVVEDVEPGPGGRVQARVLVKACVHKAFPLLRTLAAVVRRTFHGD